MARPNEADRGTDRALADLERRINSVYSKAAKDLQEEIDAFSSISPIRIRRCRT